MQMDTDMLQDEPKAPADIPGLVAQARAAYQQNRIKECLALTKAALLVDPGNTSALEMQSAVRFDMQRDLSDARALIEESRTKPNAAKYRKAAEIILLKALYLDPDSEGAKTLLSSIRSVCDPPAATSLSSASSLPAAAPSAPARTMPAPPAYVPPVLPVLPEKSFASAPVEPEPKPIVFAPPVVRKPLVIDVPQPEDFFEDHIPAIPAVVSAPVYEQPASYEAAAVPAARTETIMGSNTMEPEVAAPESIPFTVGTSCIEMPDYMKNGKKNGNRNLAIPVTLAVIVVIGAGLFVARQKLGTNAAASTTAETTPKYQEQSTQKPNSYPVPATSTREPGASAPAQEKIALAAMNTPPLSTARPVEEAPAPATKAASGIPATMGSLAVSSALAAEIYLGSKLLGSTPATLQLPTGNQTLEYRHGDLRSVVTHTIKSRETTTALITFSVTVQVNARPWATVSIEGSPRIQLGQTPLSDVQIPVGSVLVFENPNFPSKSHKIVPTDTTIQMVFP